MIGSGPRATRRPARIAPPRIKASRAPTQIGRRVEHPRRGRRVVGIAGRLDERGRAAPARDRGCGSAAGRPTATRSAAVAVTRASGRLSDAAVAGPRASVPSGDAVMLASAPSCRRAFGRPRRPRHRRGDHSGVDRRSGRPRDRRGTGLGDDRRLPQRPARAVRRVEPAPRTQVETAREQRESAPAAQRPVEARAPRQAEGLGRAASRVPGEGGGHSATEASRVGRRRRPRRPECRDGRTEPRAQRRPLARDLRSGLPPRRSLPSGRAAFRGA